MLDRRQYSVLPSWCVSMRTFCQTSRERWMNLGRHLPMADLRKRSDQALSILRWQYRVVHTGIITGHPQLVSDIVTPEYIGTTTPSNIRVKVVFVPINTLSSHAAVPRP